MVRRYKPATPASCASVPTLSRESASVATPNAWAMPKWLAEATADIAVQLAEQVPGLDSPLLKLAKERNEARDLVKRMFAAVNVDSVGEEYYSAMLEAHRAIIGWKGGAK
jgi:hypothetical protein